MTTSHDTDPTAGSSHDELSRKAAEDFLAAIEPEPPTMPTAGERATILERKAAVRRIVHHPWAVSKVRRAFLAGGVILAFATLVGLVWLALGRPGLSGDDADDAAGVLPLEQPTPALSPTPMQPAGEVSEQEQSGEPADQPAAPETGATDAERLQANTWTTEEGDIGYSFDPDGTYVFATLDDEYTGRYTVEAADDGTSHIYFYDPNDPTVIVREEHARFDGATLVLSHGDADETVLIPGDLPVPGSGEQPIVTLDAARAERRLNGSLRVSMGSELAKTNALSGSVSSEARPVDASGTLQIDAATGWVSGTLQGRYECRTPVSVGADVREDPCPATISQGAADVTVTVLSSALVDEPQTMTWEFSGEATMTITWTATEVYSDRAQPWSLTQTLTVPFTAGLERAGWAYFDVHYSNYGVDTNLEPQIDLGFQVIDPAVS